MVLQLNLQKKINNHKVMNPNTIKIDNNKE